MRKVRRFDQASHIYVTNRAYLKYEINKDKFVCAFGLMLLPMSNDRRLIAETIETFNRVL